MNKDSLSLSVVINKSFLRNYILLTIVSCLQCEIFQTFLSSAKNTKSLKKSQSQLIFKDYLLFRFVQFTY